MATSGSYIVFVVVITCLFFSISGGSHSNASSAYYSVFIPKSKETIMCIFNFAYSFTYMDFISNLLFVPLCARTWTFSVSLPDFHSVQICAQFSSTRIVVV